MSFQGCCAVFVFCWNTFGRVWGLWGTKLWYGSEERVRTNFFFNIKQVTKLLISQLRFAILRGGYLHSCLISGEKPLEPGELKTKQVDGLDFGIPCSILKNLQSNMEMLPRNIRKDRGVTLAVPDLLSYQSPLSEPILFYSEPSTEQNSPVSVLENSAFKPAVPDSLNLNEFQEDTDENQSVTMQDSDVGMDNLLPIDKVVGAKETLPASDLNATPLLDQSSKNESTEQVLEEQVFVEEIQSNEEKSQAPIATADSFEGYDDGLGEYDDDVSVFVEDGCENDEDDDLSVIIEDGPEESADEADLMVQEFAFMVTSADNENLESSVLNNEIELLSDEPSHEPCIVEANTDQEDVHGALNGALEDLKVIMKKEETTNAEEVPVEKEEIKKAPQTSPPPTKTIPTTSPVKGVAAVHSLRGSMGSFGNFNNWFSYPFM